MSGTTEKEEIARQSLARLHLFRPTSLLQLATSIKNLQSYHISHMPHDEIGMLAIDSASAFYWAERFSTEQMHNVTSEKARSKTEVAFVPALYHVLSAIQTVRVSHNPVIVLTNWALHPLSHDPIGVSPSSMLYKQHLYPFPALDGIPDLGAKVAKNAGHPLLASPFHLAHHITLSSSPPAPFPPDTPLDDALRHEAQYRKEVVGRGEVVCLVRSSGTRNARRFAFYITDEDVIVQQ
ncbi:hypothetical protein BU15DRAFT_73742 [Melanogaster broomeanus]|nr:hypothetical protein BU15DRAFT_73742 [Melanogaster broomeanus]